MIHPRPSAEMHPATLRSWSSSTIAAGTAKRAAGAVTQLQRTMRVRVVYKDFPFSAKPPSQPPGQPSRPKPKANTKCSAKPCWHERRDDEGIDLGDCTRRRP